MSKPADRKNQPTTPRPVAAGPKPSVPPARTPAPNGANRGTPPSGANRSATAKAPATANRSGRINVAPARQPVYRPAKSGFQLQPIHFAVIAVNVLILGGLIWFTLAGNNTTAGTAGTSTDTSTSANAQAAPGDTPLPNGIAAPDFSYPGTDGATYSLSQFKGKVVLLEFMAPWCPHCQEDTQFVNQVYTAYQGKNVQLLAINATTFGRNYENGDQSPITIADQQWFHDNFGLKYPLLFDKDAATGTLYNITRFPTLYVIDTAGKIAANQVAKPYGLDTISAALDAQLKLP
jgi:peroxiredoxin